MYKLQRLILGPVSANCFVITCEQTGDIAVVDPGDYNRELLDAFAGNSDKVKYILLTHRHYDHIQGAAKLKNSTGARIAVHADDSAALRDPVISHAAAHGLFQEPTEADILLQGGDKLSFGNGEIEVFHTPGHSSGGVCYLLGDMLFTGDTLFAAGSIGRTDLASGSQDALICSLKFLFSLDFAGTVYPGHGDFTALERERKIYFR